MANKTKDYLLKNNGQTNIILTAMSMAITWIWAASVFVASSMGAEFGIEGLLYYIIPNSLSILIACYFAKKVVEEMKDKPNTYTLLDFVKERATTTQYVIHYTFALVLLTCMIILQLMGLKLLFVGLFPKCNIFLWLMSVLVIVNLYTLFDGIKQSIIQDVIKYVVMFLCICVLLTKFDLSNVMTQTYIVDHWKLFKTYGLVVLINSSVSAFLDQTIWQRFFSIPRNSVRKLGVLSAVFYFILPFMIGICGLSSYPNNNFNLVSLFTTYPYNILIAIMVCCAMISTLDSALCSIRALIWNEFDCKFDRKLISKYKLDYIVPIILSIMGLIIALQPLKIGSFYLIYGVMRTCIGVASILIIVDRFDKFRLCVATIFGIVICNIGYISYVLVDRADKGWIWFLLAFLSPFIGYRNKKNDVL